MRTKLLYVFIAFIINLNSKLIAQANPNPCGFPDVNCTTAAWNGIVNSFKSKSFIYTSPNRSMPFWIAIGDTVTNTIDTSSNTLFTLSKISGPGNMLGAPASLPAKYVYFNELEFTQIGIYKVEVTAGNGTGYIDTLTIEVIPEIEFCSEAPNGDCGLEKGNQVLAYRSSSNVIPVDAVFPIIVGLVDSVTGFIDSSFVGTIYVDKVSGPGMIYGTLSMSGKKWFKFNNFKFSEAGDYVIRFYTDSLTQHKPVELEVEVIGANSIENISVSKLIVFPNPFDNHLTIELPHYNSSDEIIIGIYNSMGKLILKEEMKIESDRIQLNTEMLNSGVYLLNVHSATFQVEHSIVVKQ